MELNELKKNWQSLNSEEIDPEKIRAIIEIKYRSRFTQLWIFEILITAFNFYFIGLIMFRFDELGSGFLSILGIIVITILLVFSLLRIIGLLNLYQSGHLDQVHSEVVKTFAKQKIWFQKIQQINLGLLFFLLLSLFVLAVKIYNEYDVTQSIYFWFIAGSLSLLFVFGFKKLSKKYRNAIEEAESLLTEIENLQK